jgi:hypothetical protein
MERKTSLQEKLKVKVLKSSEKKPLPKNQVVSSVADRWAIYIG